MVASALSRAGGGVAVVVESLSRAVADAGIEVGVFGPEDETWHEEDSRLWNGAPAFALPVAGPKSLRYAPRMTRSLVSWNPDVVHLHGIWTHPSRSVLQWSRATGRPYVVSPHGMLAPAALRYSRPKKLISQALFQNATFAGARCLHATCGAERDEIRAFGLRQAAIATFANGVTIPESTKDVTKSNNARILSLGRIHPIKGLDRLLNAWALVEESFPEWTLEIVGPSEAGHDGELRRLSNELGLRHVTIAGPVYGKDKFSCIADAELFVLPTRNENFGLTVAESLACSTPVIATKGAPWKGLVDHKCGWWIDQDIAPLAAALRTAMEMPTRERHAMGRRGRDWMQRDFSWSAIGREAAAVYSWLAGATPRPGCVEASEAPLREIV